MHQQFQEKRKMKIYISVEKYQWLARSINDKVQDVKVSMEIVNSVLKNLGIKVGK